MMRMRIRGTARTVDSPAADRAVVRVTRVVVNLCGAVCAAYFARATLAYFLATHRLIGGLFLVEQAWFVVAFLIRRPPRPASATESGARLGTRLAPWLLAAGGTFGGLLLRPSGLHPRWGLDLGFALQLTGLLI